MRASLHTTGLACLVLVLGLSATVPVRADVVTEWNEQAFVSGGASRTLAMVHVAMFDAVNAIHPRYRRYLKLPPPPSTASAEAAAASAAHGVLVRLFPAQTDAFDAALAASLAVLPDFGKRAGVRYGDIVAQAIYEVRLDDNILTPGPIYVSGTTPGVYQITTPGPPQPVNTNAPNWIPFALKSASQFRPDGPPALTSKKYARDVNEVQVLGASTSQYRSADDDQAARWHTELPQFQLNRVARAETATDGRSLLAHARLFALLNITLVGRRDQRVRREVHLRLLATGDGDSERGPRRQSSDDGGCRLDAVSDHAAASRVSGGARRHPDSRRQLPAGAQVHAYLATGEIEAESVGRMVGGDSLRITGDAALRLTGRSTAELLVWTMSG